MRPGRSLAVFWAAILLLAGGGALALQLAGPPPKKPAPQRQAAGPARSDMAAAPVSAAVSASAGPARPAPAMAPAPASRLAGSTGAAGVAPVATQAVLVAAPAPALLEPAPDFKDRMLPRIGPDGTSPAVAYASHAVPAARGPQVAILLEGLGLAEDTTQAAIETLPPAVSLAVSPYAPAFDGVGTDTLTPSIRRAGHEFYLSLPMEPEGSPLDDEGPKALTTQIPFEQDRQALEWTLSRVQGYAGLTDACAGMRGERFERSAGFEMVTKALADRGLLYVEAASADKAADLPAPTPHRFAADVTLDAQPDAVDIEARLARLEQIAETRGSALGVAGPLRPVVIERLRAWSSHLASRGITLVPVSALPPQRPDAQALVPAAAPAPPPPSLPPPSLPPPAGHPT